MNYAVTASIKHALRVMPGFSADDSYSTLVVYKFPIDDARGLYTWLDYAGSWVINARVMAAVVEGDYWTEHSSPEAYTREQIERMKVLASEWIVRIKEILKTGNLDDHLIIDTGKLWQW